MSRIDLILKDIQDIYVRENFNRLKKYLNDSVFFEGDFDFYEVDIPKASELFAVAHGLKFIPADIIFLNVTGDHNVYFNYENFDRDNIYITASGPCVVRFLAGRLSDLGKSIAKNKYPFVAPSTSGGGGGGGGGDSATDAPMVLNTFGTNLATQPKDLLILTGTNTVQKITNNSSGTIPNGIFGVGLIKPTTLTISVVTMGRVGGYAGFTPGAALYISTAGIPTHTAPSTGTVQQIGFANSTTEMFVNLMQPFRRS